MSITDTPPFVLLYSTLAAFAGTRIISKSPEIIESSSSSAAAAIVNSYWFAVSFFSNCSIRYTSPIDVGPLSEPILTASFDASVFFPQPISAIMHSIKIAITAVICFFIIFTPLLN